MQPPDYSPIHRVVDAHLQSGGRRVHFWDMNHSSPVPREVYSDPGLLATVRRHGTPSYVMEWVEPNINKSLAAYRNAPPEAASQLSDLMRKFAEGYQPEDPAKAGRYHTALMRVFESSRGKAGVNLRSPDFRGAFTPDYTPDEARVMDTYQNNVHRMTADCDERTGEHIVELLSPEMRAVHDASIIKYNRYVNGGYPDGLNSGKVDERIAANVQRRSGATRASIEMVMYGGGHYIKPRDLDERLPGLSIAVVDGDHYQSMMRGTQRFGDMPDYAWYAKDNRLAPLTTDAARAEFLGLDANAYSEWQRQQRGTTPIAPLTPPLTPDAQKACDAIARRIVDKIMPASTPAGDPLPQRPTPPTPDSPAPRR